MIAKIGKSQDKTMQFFIIDTIGILIYESEAISGSLFRFFSLLSLRIQFS